MTTFRNLVIGVLNAREVDNIAKTTRAPRELPDHALPFFGISYEPDLSRT